MSVPFMPFIRLETSLGETRHVVVLFAPSVTFEMDEVSVILEIAEPSETAVEFENNARHAGGGVGMSLKIDSYTSLVDQNSGDIQQLTTSRALYD
jgi:hypothetical protein